MGNGQSGWGNGMPVGIPPGSQNGSMGQLNAMNNMHMMMPQFSMGGMMPNLMMPPAKPIGSEEDDSLLVKALKEADATGKTYRQALDALHMVCLPHRCGAPAS